MPHPRLLTALLALALTACSTSTPQAHKQPSPTPTPARENIWTTTSIPTPAASMSKIQFTHTAEQLAAALPAQLGKVPMTSTAYAPGWVAADDSNAWTTEPESCRAQLLNGGRTVSTFADFPVLPEVEAHPSNPDVRTPVVRAIPLPPTYADLYLDRAIQPAPRCTTIRIHDAGRTEAGSIVERPVPGLGVRSRLIMSNYHRAGKQHPSVTILFRTPTYFASVECFDAPVWSERDCLAFARQTESALTHGLAGR